MDERRRKKNPIEIDKIEKKGGCDRVRSFVNDQKESRDPYKNEWIPKTKDSYLFHSFILSPIPCIVSSLDFSTLSRTFQTNAPNVNDYIQSISISSLVIFLSIGLFIYLFFIFYFLLFLLLFCVFDLNYLI